MMMIHVKRDMWDAWKAQLGMLADADSVSSDDIRRCLQSLNEIAHETCETPASPGVAEWTNSPSPSERKDVATQLCTVHPINYTHHILNKVKRERQVRVLSTRLGQLGATLYGVADTLWRVLLCVHDVEKRGGRAPDTLHEAGQPPSSSARVDPSPLSLDANAAPFIPPQTSRSLQSLLAKSPSFDAALLTSFSSRTAENVRSEVEAATQASDGLSLLGDSAELRKQLPFLCRRCRQDGRAMYVYDKEKQQLAHTHVSAAQPALAQSSSASRNPPRQPPAGTRLGVPPQRQRKVVMPQKQRGALPHL
ncbi:hypothetical protein ABB37_03360 [Leptomonas pyrrhocoris]|uniref:Uncharacterized protein n=1 Tax=Leptomonas pyrrhocoris TaxID=157538 RepID=A0A0N0DWV7_LEPPY|nr:hypothetical protein ABB37_03360 [Leptomonas pyrrhocoris]KPA82248.1 hypothetical protein ABB37_03360 [Leptomonas pyrrhocoris]|eukprot:XP_015660687.1 hypothetical protein ABB37_03360 [Leptomonas pyrrhocoris]